jgi:chromosomal replication initiation ATPase DnaA
MQEGWNLDADRARARLAASVVAHALGVPAKDILAPERGASMVAFARHVAMYVCHVGFRLSLSRTAVAFRRDRSTVAHACHAIEDRREDPVFDGWVGALESAVRETPPPREHAA